jgi:hypothetical protein
MVEFPAWRIPGNLGAILEEEGEWEDPRWDPIMLTVFGGIRYNGRDIQCWEVAFSPEDDFFDDLNKALEAAGIEANGYGWLDVVEGHLTKSNPDLLERLNCLDTELATCVIWVETEADCRALIETIWTVLHNPKGPLAGAA